MCTISSFNKANCKTYLGQDWKKISVGFNVKTVLMWNHWFSDENDRFSRKTTCKELLTYVLFVRLP